MGELPPDAGTEPGVVIGAFGAGAGLAGWETFWRTEPPWTTPRSVRRTRAMAQSMNITAHQVVALDRTLAAPRGPKAVWLPAPPKAPARSAALPLCKSTTMMRTRQLRTKNPDNSQPAKRKPRTMMPTPTRSATTHFIQPGMRFSLPRGALVRMPWRGEIFFFYEIAIMAINEAIN